MMFYLPRVTMPGFGAVESGYFTFTTHCVYSVICSRPASSVVARFSRYVSLYSHLTMTILALTLSMANIDFPATAF